MLETIDLSLSLSRIEHDRCKQEIQTELYRAQKDAHDAGLGVVVLFEGWDFSGKAQCVRFIVEPMDPRGHKVHVMYPPTEHERRFPFARRYWLRLPARGQFAFFIRSWYYHVLDERVRGGESALESLVAFEEIRLFEKMLADDGNLLVKFWLHISKKEQKRRRKKIQEGLVRRWRVGPDDPDQPKRRKEYLRAIEEMLASTSEPDAEWFPISAEDRRHARVAAAQRLIREIKSALARRAPSTAESLRRETAAPAELTTADPPSLLTSLDMRLSLDENRYKARLRKAQLALGRLHYQCVDRKRPAIIVFEGWDAAGKGGTIRRLTTELDPRYFDVHSIAAPRGDEADHHYLWRFWRSVPPAGHWAIFDRSWYGRVLVERVEGFATESQWRRAYAEINEFEASLHENGAIIMKFWLHITPDEQLRRFQEREEIEYKTFKITEEDWRNRSKWSQYEAAVDDMIHRTSTAIAPWTLVPANDKKHARVTILESCIEQLRRGLKRKDSRLRKSL